MDVLFYQRSLQAGEQERLLCSRNTWCGACLKEDGCSWCNGNSQSSGSCQVLGDPTTTCSEAVTTNGSQCPSVGADVSSLVHNSSAMQSVSNCIELSLFIDLQYAEYCSSNFDRVAKNLTC